MTVDYDLVIIGSSPAGFYAATVAASMKARVALVATPPESATENSIYGVSTYSKTLTYLGGVAQKLREAAQFGIYCQQEDETSAHRHISVKFGLAMQWAAGVAANLEEQQSLAVLASLGVDAIADSGQFYPKPHLGFEVKDRRLRSRAYLLATTRRSAMPDIEGLEATGYLTDDTISHLAKRQVLPESLIVIGSNPSGIELAQTFARLGCRVTLVVRSSHILPKEDPEAALLIQAQLEAEGVRVFTKTEVTQAKLIEGKKWIQAGDRAMEADEIFLAAGQVPNVESLNLESVDVKWHQGGIQVNEKLQTTNPRIYACSDVYDGYQMPNLAKNEADIALKNALYLPVFKVDNRAIPRAIFTDPQLARVGLMESQARSRYGSDVLVLRQYFKTVAKAQISGETTGFCKIIVRRNGEILGACIVGSQAAEMIHSFALAVRQRMKVGAIASIPHIWPSFSEIAGNTADVWNRQRHYSNTRLQDFLEGLFNWRRGRW